MSNDIDADADETGQFFLGICLGMQEFFGISPTNRMAIHLAVPHLQTTNSDRHSDRRRRHVTRMAIATARRR